MPLIMSEATILLDTHSKQHYRVGDVVAYIGSGGSSTVHRIIFSMTTASGHRRYLLKGDHNCGSDGFIDAQYIFGKVQKVVYLSYEIDLTTPLSLYASKLIARCGRITGLCRPFYILERVVTVCLITAMMLHARSSLLLCDKIPCSGDAK